MNTGIEHNVEDYCLGLAMRRASRVLSQVYDSHLAPCGLKVTQFSMLRVLGRSGETNAKQIQTLLTLDQTTTSRGLGVLVRDGLVEEFNGEDKRQKRLRLSREGKTRWRQAEKLWVNAQQEVAQHLGEKAYKDLYRVSDAILSLRS